jgi:predicted heme/steroid binding protein
MEDTKKFTLSELAQFNGKNGHPCYVGYNGKVYDATGSSQWIDGDHLGHVAGSDLTKALEVAPHSEEVMKRLKIVGILV